MKTFATFALVCTFFLSACQHNELNFQTIDVDDILANEKELFLSDFAKDIDYVSLKAPFRVDAGLTGLRRYDVIVGDKQILLGSTYYQKVFVFDRKGNYVNDIGIFGFNEDELFRLMPYRGRYFALSPDENMVILKDNSRIKLFKISGEYMGSTEIPEGSIWNLEFLSNEKIITFRKKDQLQGKGDYQIKMYDLNFKLTDSLFYSLATERPMQGKISQGGDFGSVLCKKTAVLRQRW